MIFITSSWNGSHISIAVVDKSNTFFPVKRRSFQIRQLTSPHPMNAWAHDGRSGIPPIFDVPDGPRLDHDGLLGFAEGDDQEYLEVFRDCQRLTNAGFWMGGMRHPPRPFSVAPSNMLCAASRDRIMTVQSLVPRMIYIGRASPSAGPPNP